MLPGVDRAHGSVAGNGRPLPAAEAHRVQADEHARLVLLHGAHLVQDG